MSAVPAGSGAGPRGSSTLRALAELRLLLTWRRLRGRGGVAELVARAVLLVLALPAGTGLAFLAGSGAYRTVRAGGGLVVSVATGVFFLGIWTTWTVVALTLSDRESFDLRRLLGYPVPPWQAYAYDLAASVVGDPFVLFWCVILVGAFAGAALARPGGWVVLLALAYLLFVVGVTAMVALLQELFARALRHRRVREIGVAGIYVALILLVARAAIGGSLALWQSLRRVVAARWVAYPAALAGEAVARLYQGRTAAAVPWLAALGAAAAVTGWAAYRLALADAMEGTEGARAEGAAGGTSWPLVGPLLEKELKYLLRHPLAVVLCLVFPCIAAAGGWLLVPRLPEDAGELVRALPLMGLALYTLLATQAFWLNAFGWDRGGAKVWFLAPLDLAGVLRAKNLAVQALSLAVFAGSAAALIATGGPPPAWAMAAALALHLGAGAWFVAAGNVVSVLNPRPAAYSLQRGGGLSSVSALAGLGIVSAVTALFVPPVILALHLERPWVLVAGWIALAGAGAAVHRAVLPATARLLERRREELLAAAIE